MSDGNKKSNSPARDWLYAHVNHSSQGCLIWPFSRRWNGYGQIGINGKIGYAHRLMCELVNGAPPTKFHLAAHSCGKGGDGCVNPLHLSWKTPRENQMDRVRDGTTRKRGEWSRSVRKVSEHDKATIISLKGKLNQREIGKMFGISDRHVSLLQREASGPDHTNT